MKLSKSTSGKRKFHIETWHIKALFLMAYDIMAISISYFFALWIRFDGVFSEIPEKYLDPYVNFLPVYIIISLIVFYAMRMYHSVWEYVSIRELMRAAIGSIAVSVVHIILITVSCRECPYHIILSVRACNFSCSLPQDSLTEYSLPFPSFSEQTQEPIPITRL